MVPIYRRPNWVFDFWLWSGPDSTIVGIWGVNQNMECHSLLLPFSCQICTFKKNQKCISYLTKGEWLGWKLSNLWTPRLKRRNNCKHISTFSINGRKGNTCMKVLYHATQIRKEPRRENWWFSLHCRFLGLNRNCLSRARGKHCSRLQFFCLLFPASLNSLSLPVFIFLVKMLK